MKHIEQVILLTGASGAGKDTVTHVLEHKGWHRVPSFTTREPRDPVDETRHEFVKLYNKDNLPKYNQDADMIVAVEQDTDPTEPVDVVYTGIVAFAELFSEAYWATIHQFKAKSVYIINPGATAEAVRRLEQLAPKAEIHIVHLDVPAEVAEERARNRKDQADTYKKREGKDEQELYGPKGKHAHYDMLVDAGPQTTPTETARKILAGIEERRHGTSSAGGTQRN